MSPKPNTNGAMADFPETGPDERPWVDEKTRVTTINVESGVTVIGKYCFYDFPNLTSVTLPVGLKEIHKYGFGLCVQLQSISIPFTVTQIDGLAFGYCYDLLNVYCYPNPDNMTWNISVSDFAEQTPTTFYVYDTYLSAYQSKFNNVPNIVFVGDLTTSGNWTSNGNFSTSFHQSGNTIYIDNEADLARVAYCVNTGVTEYINWTFILTRDLDMAAHYWTAIGFYKEVPGENPIDHSFRGNFEGNGHTISGITFRSDNNSDYAGLFGYVGGNVKHNPGNVEYYDGCDYIKNLIVTHATVKGNSFVGGVAGCFHGESLFENVICQANVTGHDRVGGIIGEAMFDIDQYHPQNTLLSIPTVKNNLLIGGKITGQELTAAVIGNIGYYSDLEKNFYINPESATGNNYEVRAYPVTKSNIPENVTVTIDTEPGLTYQGTYYAPAGTVNFSVQNNDPINHITIVKMNNIVLQATSGNNYSFEIVPATEAYDITVTVDHSVIFNHEGDWNDVSNWSTNTLPSSNDNVIIRANATIPSGFVAQAGQITIESGGSLTIADGGQLIHNNAGVTATVKKNITAYTVGQSQGNDLTNGWYFIASPINESLALSGILI